MNVSDVTNYAKSFIGKVQYVFGGTDVQNGKLDCSSYVQEIYRKFGYSLPRTTFEQVNYGKYVSPENAREGDMVLFENTYTSGVSHVGYYLGNGKVIHNSGTGVKISDLTSGYYKEHLHSFRRVLSDDFYTGASSSLGDTLAGIGVGGSAENNTGSAAYDLSFAGNIMVVICIAICLILAFIFLMGAFKVEV